MIKHNHRMPFIRPRITSALCISIPNASKPLIIHDELYSSFVNQRLIPFIIKNLKHKKRTVIQQFFF